LSDLSVESAAAEAPGAAGLVDDDGALTFETLAALARERTADLPTDARVLIAPRATRDDAILLLGLLARRASIVLAHDRWTAAERRDAAARTGAAVAITEGVAQRTGHGGSAPAGEVCVFTSGSSGRPKIVRLGYAALLAAAEAHAAALPWTDDDRWVLTLPLGHVGGLSILTRSLFARRPVVLGPARFDPDALRDAIARHRGTLLSLVPAMLERLMDRPPPPTLRAVLLGGASARPERVAAAREAGWPVLPTYGMSETCAQVCTQRLGDERPDGVGPPMPGVRVRIRDGAIEVAGPTLLCGYLDAPPPLVDGWYPTGDLGHLDADGHLHVTGRADARIITGGENVDPTEVERALLAHPAIREAVVLGVPDPRWGQRVVAVIVADPPPDADAIALHLEPRLARFKHPKQVVARAALPRLASGKVDRTGLAGAFDAP